MLNYKIEVMSLRQFSVLALQHKSNFVNFHLSATSETTLRASNIISDEDKKVWLERLRKTKIHYKQPKKSLKNAAVLIPFCIVNNELSLLYTLRHSDLRRHRGQVSFPGGIQDKTDRDLTHTAVRETEEELGINSQLIEVWGHGNAIVGTEFNVYPVLGYVGEIDLKSLKPNPSEVELAFAISINHLCNKENCRHTQFRNKYGSGYVLPVYINGIFKVWGMTALITHLVLNAIAPDKYNHPMHFIR